jgi:tetratricopeptide (TPR) repeat protein
MLVLVIGCASKEEKKVKHFERAREYVKKQELNKAVIEYKNVIQLDPKDDGAYYELGDALLKLKQGREAFQAYSQAVSINPGNLEAQLKIGQILLLNQKTEEAREKAELILEKSPESAKALNLLAGIQIQEKDIDSALKTLEKATSIAPDHFTSQLSLARVWVLKGDFMRAEQAYVKARTVDPAPRVSYLELSRLYGKTGRWDKAEAELKKMIQASESNYQDLHVLAVFYESRKRWHEAEKTYLEAVDASPREDVMSLIQLAGYYARRKSYDKALDSLNKAAEVKKDDLNIQVTIAQLHFDFNKFEEAENTVDKVLEKDQGHVSANFLKGRLYLLKKDYSNAFKRFELVVTEQPRNALGHYFRAMSLIGKGESKPAQQDLVRAVELNPWMLEARIVLAEFYLRQRSKNLAQQQIEVALRLAPKDIRVLMLEGDLEILRSNFKGAETAFKKVTALNPDYAAGYFKLGVLYYSLKRNEDALNSLQKAIELNPQFTTALAMILNIHIRNENFEEALQICERQKAKSGGNPSALSTIEYLEGSVFEAKGDTDKAVYQFNKAIETDPNILAPYASLANLYRRSGQLDEALKQYEAILKKKPKNVGAHMAVGTIYDVQGKPDKAETSYRKALEIDKNFAPAANNLAWNLAHEGGNIDEALSFAQLAKEKMPKNAGVIDTLGWIYYLKGSYLSAITELQDSVDLAPDHPVINYHLGMAYHKNNQQDEAKRYLTKALEFDENFSGADEARRILKELEASS